MEEVKNGPSLDDLRPKRGFFEAIWNHLRSWAAEYTVLLLTFASVWFAAIMYYLLSGRAPQENLSWMIDYSPNCIKIALAITFTSAFRQSVGTWYRKDELLDRPLIILLQTISSLSIFGMCLYVISH